MQIGGGITAETATQYLDAGASHVIVTSYVFRDGKIDEDNLKKLVSESESLCYSATSATQGRRCSS